MSQGVLRRSITGVICSMLVLLVVPSFALAQTSGVGGRVTNPNPDNPRTSSIFVYSLERGQTKQDQITISNKTDQEKVVSLASVDGVATNTGAYTCRQESEAITGSGGWVTLAKDRIVLPAGGEEVVDFTVDVPGNADVGEHNSCITIQAGEEDDDDATSGIRLRMRSAIRMVVTIPGELHRQLSISQFDVTSVSGSQSYLFEASNKGNVSADVDMRVRVTNIFGREIASIGGTYPVLADESLLQNFTTELAPLFGGYYTATPSIRYDTRMGVWGTATQGASYEAQVGTAVSFFLWPTVHGWIILASLMILLCVGIWWIMSSRKHQRLLYKSSKPYVVREGDTIESLAKQHAVEWRRLAKLNKLQAPYTINVGQEILLPVLSPKTARRRTKQKKS